MQIVPSVLFVKHCECRFIILKFVVYDANFSLQYMYPHRTDLYAQLSLQCTPMKITDENCFAQLLEAFNSEHAPWPTTDFLWKRCVFFLSILVTIQLSFVHRKWTSPNRCWYRMEGTRNRLERQVVEDEWEILTWDVGTNRDVLFYIAIFSFQLSERCDFVIHFQQIILRAGQ